MSLNPPANPAVFPARSAVMAALERAAERARIIAEQTGTQLIVTQVPAQEMAALATEDYITQRGQHASAEKFAVALALVPDIPVIGGDELQRGSCNKTVKNTPDEK